MSNDEASAIVNSDGVLDGPAAAGVTLEFVNVGALSKAEKDRNQKLIRSTAMKSFRRRQQTERSQKNNEGSSSSKDAAKSKGLRPKSESRSPVPEGYVQVLPFSTTDSSPEASFSRFSESSWQVGGSPDERNDEYRGRKDTDRGESVGSQGSRQGSRSPSGLGSPVTLLGAGRTDPFQLLPVKSSSQINELLDHSVTRLWPGLRPRRSNGAESAISSAWLERIYERPVVMHALLFGASVHMDVLRSPRLSLDNPVRLYHKVQTMRLLKEELKSPEKTPLDEVLLAVLCLAANEVETVANNMKEKIQSPFNSPLKSAQWLDVYGSITHIHAHTLAMRSLVCRRGGLEKIELEGLAEVLSFADILGATQTLSKPHWPLLKRTQNTKLDIPCPSPTTERLGRGFQELWSFGVTERAANVFQEMTDLTRVIGNHCRGRTSIPSMTILIDHRNTVQHNLLSLPNGSELEPGEVRFTSLYDSIRHAAIIYSAAVIFPLPPLTGILGKFATALKAILKQSQSNPGWQLCLKTLIWILILGGIAASGTPERKWYVQNLAAVSSACNILEWEDVEEVLQSYLWLESACDAGGRLLWMEVTNERLARRHESEGSPES